MSFQNKHIVITGGTSGIGLELVKKLAKQNKLIVISKKGSLPKSLAKTEYPVSLYHANLADKSDIESVFNKIQHEHSCIDVLINNAAIQNTTEFLADEFNYDAIQTEIDTNFTAVCHLTYLFLPLLLAAPHGQIINMNSGLAIAPKQGSAVYCASKAALYSFSKSLTYQLEKTTVRVRQIFLPLVDTPMTQGRGINKLNAADVAQRIIQGQNDIGKVPLLRILNSIAPPLARRIMKGK